MLLQFLQILLISPLFAAQRFKGIFPRKPVQEAVSPCPNIFTYQKISENSNWTHLKNVNLKWRGIVSIPPPSNFPIILEVVLALLYSDFAANNARLVIEPAEGLDVIEDKVYSGDFEKIKYYVYFPASTKFLPLLRWIKVNSNILCSAFPVFEIAPEFILRQSLTIKLPTIEFLEDSSDRTVLDFSGESCGTSELRKIWYITVSAAKKGYFPYIVPLFKRIWTFDRLGELEYFCGATLISQELLLTAAHCLQSVDKEDIIADVGRFNITNWNEKHVQRKEIETVYIHPDYNSETYYSDIAVLKLKEKIVQSPYAIPACLWSGDESLDKVVGTSNSVFGWGKIGNKTPHTPKGGPMPIASQEDCLRSNVQFFYLTSNRTFCAGSRNGEDPCRGASGGGLFLRQKRTDGSIRWYLRGIVSVALRDIENGCDGYEYTVFADVAKFRDWIFGLT